MSEKSIWNKLRAEGLTEQAVGALMGNMYAESLLKSDNVEDRCALSDSEYTSRVDSGLMSLAQFQSDAYGYGLCQWTYFTRKRDLYNYAKFKGVSISDEMMQCEFCLKEIKEQYSSLYQYLKQTTDMYTATARICQEYERPAVNNISARYSYAQTIFNRNSGSVVESVQSVPVGVQTVVDKNDGERVEISVRVLKKGDMGRDVFMLQCGLNDMRHMASVADGDFGWRTEQGVNELKAMNNLVRDGIADKEVWQILLS